MNEELEVTCCGGGEPIRVGTVVVADVSNVRTVDYPHALESSFLDYYGNLMCEGTVLSIRKGKWGDTLKTTFGIVDASDCNTRSEHDAYDARWRAKDPIDALVALGDAAVEDTLAKMPLEDLQKASELAAQLLRILGRPLDIPDSSERADILAEERERAFTHYSAFKASGGKDDDD